jgi:hypothetical protein
MIDLVICFDWRLALDDLFCEVTVLNSTSYSFKMTQQLRILSPRQVTDKYVEAWLQETLLTAVIWYEARSNKAYLY